MGFSGSFQECFSSFPLTASYLTCHLESNLAGLQRMPSKKRCAYSLVKPTKATFRPIMSLPNFWLYRVALEPYLARFILLLTFKYLFLLELLQSDALALEMGCLFDLDRSRVFPPWMPSNSAISLSMHSNTSCSLRYALIDACSRLNTLVLTELSKLDVVVGFLCLYCRITHSPCDYLTNCFVYMLIYSVL